MMKMVKEHINESFVNNDNKLNSLGIGKIQLIKIGQMNMILKTIR